MSRLLVVDDQQSVRNMLKAVLEQNGFRVDCAASGEEALEAAAAGKPDLICMDVYMGEGLTGIQACSRIRGMEGLSHTPILFMTVSTNVLDQIKAFRAGATDYIRKPFDPEEIVARIGLHLDEAARRQQMFQTNERLATQNMDLQREVTRLQGRVSLQSERIQEVNLALLTALERANTLNDDDTGEHINRVASYAALLAESLGCVS